MGIKITKMQGCGNDFVIIDYNEFKKLNMEMPDAAIKLCDRNFGIGADGLIIPNPKTDDADIGWYFYNSDGSTAQMCGNGMRCFAKYVYDKKLVTLERLQKALPQRNWTTSTVCPIHGGITPLMRLWAVFRELRKCGSP